ncbi:MAG: IS256 family transposase, partial [Microcoleus sp. SIO2G3]|nr:IS256 family transposase [Microcoleus sp. SIO2G3]
MKQLTKRLVKKALQAELSHHLQTECAVADEATPPEPRRNTRNGFSKKTVQADLGQLQIQVPRDRHSEFEPVLVKKG